MPQQVELIQAEASANRFHFIGVTLDCPQGWIVGFFRISRVQLIVLIEFDSVEWQEVLKPLEIPVICARATM